MNDPTQIELKNPPNDGISNVCFHPTDPDCLLVSSWDKVSFLFIHQKSSVDMWIILHNIDIAII